MAEDLLNVDALTAQLATVNRDVAIAALAAILELHRMQERPVRSYEACIAHARDPRRRGLGHFKDIRECPDCSCTEYYVCSHCECPNDVWPCPTVRSVARLLKVTHV